MSDLPYERVTPGEPPFTFVGVDYFGPFYVKRGCLMEKRYGVHFTFLVVRAVHIEAKSLTVWIPVHLLTPLEGLSQGAVRRE